MLQTVAIFSSVVDLLLEAAAENFYVSQQQNNTSNRLLLSFDDLNRHSVYPVEYLHGKNVAILGLGSNYCSSTTSVSGLIVTQDEFQPVVNGEVSGDFDAAIKASNSLMDCSYFFNSKGE